MPFCSKCGMKVSKEASFCPKCGAKSISETKSKPESNLAQTTTVPSGQSKGKTNWGVTGAILGCGCLALIVLGIAAILVLSFLGAKGQPGSIIKPSSVKTPKNLTATAVNGSIDLSWKKSGSGSVTKYNVYKSQTSGDNFQKLSTLESTTNLTYNDINVKKGVTYYYVVSAVSTDGTESGNSNQVSYALTPAPLLPNGVQTWKDVLIKYDADSKYAALFEKVTGLTRSNIESYITLENQGKTLKKKLAKGTIITNTTENYKILPHYTLNEDKWFLTNEKGVPYVMVWCGNPIKLIKEMTTSAQIIETIQDISYDVIYVFPTYVTNIIIYASQPVSDAVCTIIPDDTLGPGFYHPDHPQDDPTLTDDTGDEDLEEGEQWAVEGQLLVKADPVDPAPGQSVTMTVTLIPAEAGITIEYDVQGTDGYTDSESKKTDSQGKIQFHIPGGEKGVVDTIKVSVPEKNLEGSTSYTF